MKGSALFSAGRRQTTLVLGDQIIVSGANFVTGLILARSLGPDGFGQFVLAYNVALLVSGIQIAVVISPMMVIGPTVSEAKKADYGAAVVVEQLLGCIAVATVILITGLVGNHFLPQWGLKGFLWPLSLAVCGFVCQDFSRRYLFARDSAGAALGSDLITHGLKVALLGVFGAMLALNVPSALLIMAFASSAGVLSAIAAFRSDRALRWPGCAAVSDVNRLHWNFGKWLLANSIVYWCSSKVIIYMAGALISATAVGNISAALNVVGAANILFLAMDNLVPSRAARTYAHAGQEGLSRYLRRVAVIGGMGTLTIVAIAAYWPEFWLRLFYGGAYQDAAWMIAWCGLFYLLGFFQRPISAGLRVLGNTRAIFLGSVVGALVALLVSYPAIRWAGIVGVMAALCIVQAAVMVTLWACYRGTRNALQSGRSGDTGLCATALASSTNVKEGSESSSSFNRISS